jgi:hypothetical protein
VKTILTIGTETGYLFEGTQSGSLVFVPATCVSSTSNGKLQIDKLKYVESGWDVKNLRFNNGETSGNRLFPNPNRLITSLNETAPACFIERLQRSHPSTDE